jgi:Na+/pantothenate symporter
MISLRSHSPTGRITQAAHFIGFVSELITADLAGQVSAAFTAGLKWVQLPQQPLLSLLVALVSLMVRSRKVEELTNILLSLTVQAHLQEAMTTKEILRLCSCVLSAFRVSK